MNDKPPVILQLVPSLTSGGVERGTIEIAQAIQDAGYQALVASSGGAMQPHLLRTGATHITVPLDKKTPLALWANCGRIKSIIKKYKVDIVHARSRAPAWSGYYAAKSCGVKFVTTFHGTYNFSMEAKRKYNAIMTKGDRVIAISDFIAEHIKRNYEMDMDKLRIIPRNVDLNLFNKGNSRPQRMADLAKEWHLPEDQPLILCPGRLARWKGQDVFIEALAALPHRNFIAVILGDDKKHERYRTELENLIIKHQLQEHVRIAAYTNYVVEAYNMAKMVVAPSKEPEAFGRVALETQAMERPIIAAAHGGSLETVKPTETGFLVAPGNIDQLSSSIQHVLEMTDEELAIMGENGRANAEQFSLDRMRNATMNIYRELL